MDGKIKKKEKNRLLRDFKIRPLMDGKSKHITLIFFILL